MELEFLEKIQVELKFHELEYFAWNLISKKRNLKKKKFYVHVHYNSIFQKSSFTFETQFSKTRISK